MAAVARRRGGRVRAAAATCLQWASAPVRPMQASSQRGPGGSPTGPLARLECGAGHGGAVTARISRMLKQLDPPQSLDLEKVRLREWALRGGCGSCDKVVPSVSNSANNLPREQIAS